MTLKFIREDGEESITDANNVTTYVFSNASNSQREILNAIFRSEKLEKLDYLVNAINNVTIKYARF